MSVSATEAIDRFGSWFDLARCREAGDATAAALATATPEGVPSVRMVLLKAVNETGFTFYTNSDSRKGHELKANPNAALCLYWPALDRQVRIEGRVHPVCPEDADAYFSSRPRGSRIGAWASRQSRVLRRRPDLEQRVAMFTARFADTDIPRPPHWVGMCLKPRRIEFWSQGDNRLHEREVFERDGQSWRTYHLYP